MLYDIHDADCDHDVSTAATAATTTTASSSSSKIKIKQKIKGLRKRVACKKKSQVFQSRTVLVRTGTYRINSVHSPHLSHNGPFLSSAWTVGCWRRSKSLKREHSLAVTKSYKSLSTCNDSRQAWQISLHWKEYQAGIAPTGTKDRHNKQV